MYFPPKLQVGLTLVILLAGVPHVTASGQPECENHEGAPTFLYGCTGKQEDVCIKGRHLRVPESTCAQSVDPDEICIPCEEGTFMDAYNSCDYCKPLKQCGPGEVENPDSPPSPTNDRECIPGPQPSASCPPCSPSTCPPCPVCPTVIPDYRETQSQTTSTAPMPDDPSTTAHPNKEDCIAAEARVTSVERDRDHWQAVAVVFIVLFLVMLILFVLSLIYICIRHLHPQNAKPMANAKEDANTAPTAGQNKASEELNMNAINGDACRVDMEIDESQGGQQLAQGNSSPKRRSMNPNDPNGNAPNRHAGSSSSSHGDRARKGYTVDGNTPSTLPLLASGQTDSWRDNSMPTSAHHQSLASGPGLVFSAASETQMNENAASSSMQPTRNSYKSLSAYEKAEGECGLVTRCNEAHIDFIQKNIDSKTRVDFFTKLDIPKKDVDDEDIDHGHENVRERTRCVLIKSFLQKSLDPSINKLLRALEDSGNRDVATVFTKKFNVR